MSNGLIAVDKMGTKVLFLNPDTYETETVLDGFPRTVHELLVVPETGLAYVPIFGDGIHGRNPNPGHLLCVIDLHKRAHVGDIDLRPYIAPHTLKRGPDGLIYITCENSAVVAVIDPSTHKVVDAIDSGSTNGHRLIISPDGQRLYTENEEDATVSVIDLPNRKLLRKIKTPRALAGIAIAPDDTVIAVDDVEPTLFLIDVARDDIRTLRLEGVPKAAQIARYREDNSVLARDQPEQRHREPDRSLLCAPDRDRGRQPADGHGVPRRRAVRRLPGRRLGARHRRAGAALEVELCGRQGLRVARVLLTRKPFGKRSKRIRGSFLPLQHRSRLRCAQASAACGLHRFVGSADSPRARPAPSIHAAARHLGTLPLALLGGEAFAMIDQHGAVARQRHCGRYAATDPTGGRGCIGLGAVQIGLAHLHQHADLRWPPLHGASWQAAPRHR